MRWNFDPGTLVLRRQPQGVWKQQQLDFGWTNSHHKDSKLPSKKSQIAKPQSLDDQIHRFPHGFPGESGGMGLIYKSWHPRILNHQIRLRFWAFFVDKIIFNMKVKHFLLVEVWDTSNDPTPLTGDLEPKNYLRTTRLWYLPTREADRKAQMIKS